MDDTGAEIPIYCDKGFIVPRRIARYSRNTLPHGVLMDLRTVNELFETPWDEDYDMDLDDTDLVKCYTYPQAGLKIAGHFQAYGLMKKFSRFIDEVNDDLNNLAVEEGDDQLDHAYGRVVQGVACQGYNAVMHSTRGDSAQHHDAQLGMITGALAGSWASTPSTERIAQRLQERCSWQLPHESFTEKIENDQISRDLRLENVYFINVQELHERHKNAT
jgi:hypothetical protein